MDAHNPPPPPPPSPPQRKKNKNTDTKANEKRQMGRKCLKRMEIRRLRTNIKARKKERKKAIQYDYSYLSPRGE